jgi:putative peptide zinc metalloprotease protein
VPEPSVSTESCKVRDHGTTGSSRVRLSCLTYHREGETWSVGCADSGEVVDLPPIGITVLCRLETGATFDQAGACAKERHGEAPDVAEFVEDLVELGFVTHIDDVPVRADEPGSAPSAGSSLAWLKSQHVQWLFSWPAQVCVLLFITCGFAVAFAEHRLHLEYRAYFASRYPAVTIAWSLAVFAASATLHESAHLVAARSAGVPARITLSTRLIYLMPQTSAPLLWLVDRRLRLRFYLAGMVSDLALAAGTAMISTLLSPQSTAARLADSATLMIVIGALLQCAVCLRTDLYLVVQALLGCRNLYADARAYAVYLCRRVSGIAGALSDPTDELPVRERRRVRVYAGFMVIGVAGLLVMSGFYGVPIALSLYVQAFHAIGTGRPLQIVDGSAAIVFGIGADLLPFYLILKRLARQSSNVRRYVSAAAEPAASTRR